MAISRRALADGEEVVYEARPHWCALGLPMVLVAAVAAALVALAVARPGTPVAVAEALGAVGAVALVWLAGRLVRWSMSTLAVTTLRIVDRKGVLSRRGEEVRLDRVASVSYRQSLGGMVLGFGRLHIDTGGGPAIVLAHVRHPGRVQAIVAEQSAWARQRFWGGADPAGWPGGAGPAQWAAPPAGWSDATAPGLGGSRRGIDGLDVWSETPPAGTAAVSRSRSVAERLAVLGDLYRQGLVNEDEYLAKRAELLTQI